MGNKLQIDNTVALNSSLRNDSSLISEYLISLMENHTTYFTDGSKSSQNVGCTVVLEDTVIIRYPLSQFFFIYSTELKAI